jgi:hypothetical protein
MCLVRFAPSVVVFVDVNLCRPLDMGIILEATKLFSQLISVVTASNG